MAYCTGGRGWKLEVNMKVTFKLPAKQRPDSGGRAGGGCGQSRLVASSTGPGHRPRLNRPRYVTPSRCESESVWLGIRQLARGRTPLRTPPRSAGPMQSRPAASSPASRVLRSGCHLPMPGRDRDPKMAVTATQAADGGLRLAGRGGRRLNRRRPRTATN